MSIRRNAGRSFFIGFSVSLAVVIAVWVVSFFDGMNAQIEKAVVSTNTGFFQIQDPVYAYSTDSSAPHALGPELLKKLTSSQVLSYSPELVFDGNISTPEGSAGLLVLGVEPELHKNFITLQKSISRGSFVGPQSVDEVVIGSELARIFSFSIGDQLVLNFQDQKGELRSELLNIKGIYRYGSTDFEKKFIYTNHDTWKKLFLTVPTDGRLFNRIGIMTRGMDSEPQIRAFTDGSQLKVKSWKQLNPEMAVVLDFHDGMTKFFLLIIAITITMTILTPVRMLWQERFKELKMMSVLGVTNQKFWKIGFFEICLMVLLSASFSCVLLFAIVGTQARYGIDMSFFTKGIAIERAGIELPKVIYPLLSAGQLVLTFGFVIFVLSFSYVWSIFRTLKKLEGAI